jgi:hypothetical protein
MSSKGAGGQPKQRLILDYAVNKLQPMLSSPRKWARALKEKLTPSPKRSPPITGALGGTGNSAKSCPARSLTTASAAAYRGGDRPQLQ